MCLPAAAFIIAAPGGRRRSGYVGQPTIRLTHPLALRIPLASETFLAGCTYLSLVAGGHVDTNAKGEPPELARW